MLSAFLQQLGDLLAQTTPPSRAKEFTVAWVREETLKYLDEYDDELERFPEQAEEPHWNLWMDDSDWHNAFFVAVVVRPDSLEYFCGRGTSSALRDFAEHWDDDLVRTHEEALRRGMCTSPRVWLDRATAEGWFGRGLGLEIGE